MQTVELVGEMRAAIEAMERRDFAQLRQLGVTRMMAGIGRVRDVGDGLYQPEESPWGHWRWITPVCVQYQQQTPETDIPETPFCGYLIDLVAWHEHKPEDWLLRTGHAQWLGRIEPQYCNPNPVEILRSPLSWLRNNCIGLVPLSRKRSEIYEVLMYCSYGMTAEDRAHAANLQHILKYPLPRPPVYVGG
jgi:hypothetical protein